MKKVLLFLLISFSSCLPKAEQENCRLIRVIDGDTIVVLDSNNNEQHIRLIGINAPESRDFKHRRKEAYGKEATDFMKDLLRDRAIRLEYDRERYDKYGRTLAYVFTGDSIFVNDSIIRAGYAKVMSIAPNLKFEKQFKRSEEVARINKIGVWSDR